jgi:microcystin-dependent protein
MSPYAGGGGSSGMAELPVGTILDWAGTFDANHKPDAGEWMECDGTAINQTTYADLYAVFGGGGSNRWGIDAGGNFFLPNFKRRVTVGRDPCTGPGTVNNVALPRMDGVNNVCLGGCESKVLSSSEMPCHCHSTGYCSVSTGMSGSACTMNGTLTANYTSAYWTSCNTGTCGSTNGHLMLPPYAVVYKLIKAKKAS